MRKITQQAINAFMNDFTFNNSNTQVTIGTNKEGKHTILYLFGNEIVHKINGQISISNCGYFTNTTKERLNGIPGVRINQSKGKWFLNGKEWDGKPTKIN